ncbi:hypothetical protein J2797_005929 [Paraburkholderia terricola]|uniref:hypothetical protein n=1 Tax=Paraburkholderia terricola TaxID=169427 RepID=UPI0028674502|nr:hypothetical protein [Paraburkholderia terricola]MDR6496004.1 hypothetical protein [Paraburkholderia terricola]
MATDISHVQRELRRQLDDAVADALQAQIFRDFARDGERYLMLAQAKLKAVARRCFDAQVCLDRASVQQAGAVARAERIRGH